MRDRTDATGTCGTETFTHVLMLALRQTYDKYKPATHLELHPITPANADSLAVNRSTPHG